MKLSEIEAHFADPNNGAAGSPGEVLIPQRMASELLRMASLVQLIDEEIPLLRLGDALRGTPLDRARFRKAGDGGAPTASEALRLYLERRRKQRLGELPPDSSPSSARQLEERPRGQLGQ